MEPFTVVVMGDSGQGSFESSEEAWTWVHTNEQFLKYVARYPAMSVEVIPAREHAARLSDLYGLFPDSPEEEDNQ